MHFILGSSSPRRKEILEFFSLPFLQISSDFVEEEVVFHGEPIIYTMTLSEEKAKKLGRSYPNSYILTADTTVFCDGKLYGKPANKKESFQFLSDLSGRSHEVYTAVSLYHNKEIFSNYEMTKVFFHTLSQEQIEKYLAAFSCLDKAGGYGVQKGGSILIKKIEGCFYNVMGLPIQAVAAVLKKAGIDLWDYLK